METLPQPADVTRKDTFLMRNPADSRNLPVESVSTWEMPITTTLAQLW